MIFVSVVRNLTYQKVYHQILCAMKTLFAARTIFLTVHSSVASFKDRLHQCLIWQLPLKGRLFLPIMISFSFFTLVGCGTVERPTRPSATGRAGELLIVSDRALWEGAEGEIIRSTFQQLEPMFLQPEPMFDLVHIDQKNFTSLFETHRHIFFAEIGPQFDPASLEIQRDVWAYPQMVIRARAPNDSVFARLMERNQEAFIDKYLGMERERLINAYRRMANHAARSAVYNKFGIQMQIPEGYFVAVEADDFIWLRRTGTREDLDMGVLIAALPYKDPAIDFNHETIAARRDSLTKKFIPGQFAGSFMTTYPELTPQFREINFNGRYAIEARSLWRVEGDYMGGPFVNYTVVDETRNRLFIFDGFVYAPGFNKRDYLRQVKAVIYSAEFPEADVHASQ